MSDISVAIPYNGGSLQSGFMQSHSCYLGGGKVVNVAAQSTPNYLFCWVSNNTNFTSGTFTSANASARVLMQGTQIPSNLLMIRLFKLTATSVLLVMNNNLYVITLDANDNPTLKNATITNYWTVGNGGASLCGNAPSYATSSTVYSAQGSAFQGFYARDNVVYTAVASVSGSTTTVLYKKLTYDPVADTLTTATIYTHTATASVPLVRSELIDIPGSTTKLLYLRLQASSGAVNQVLGAAYVAWSVLIDANDVTTSVPLNSAGGVQTLCPLSTTNILGFTGSRTYYTYNGTAWNQNLAYFGANGNTTTTSPLMVTLPIDSNYFLMISTLVTSPGQNSNPTDLSGQNVPIYYKIGRFIDNQFGQTSQSTSSSTLGLTTTATSTGFFVYDQSFVVRDGSTFLLPCRALSGTSPTFRVLFAPGA